MVSLMKSPFHIANFDKAKAEEIDHCTRGRNDSLNPTNIVWVCLLKGCSAGIPLGAIPTLPQDLEEIASLSREFSAEAMVLRASEALIREQVAGE